MLKITLQNIRPALITLRLLPLRDLPGLPPAWAEQEERYGLSTVGRLSQNRNLCH